jgi:hypothetical protein
MSADMIRKTLGEYRVDIELGHGRSSILYEATEENGTGPVAAKLFHSDVVQGPAALTKFAQEANRLTKLSHKSLIPVLDFGEAGGLPYLIMPLMTGGNLADRLANGPLPIGEGYRFIALVSEALHFLHIKGIVHGDLKPTNILFDEDGAPLLSDIALPSLAIGFFDSPPVRIPDVLYVSPEQVRDRSMDARSDIYSLGAIAYHVLTGNPPFEARTPKGVMFKHATRPPVSPSEIRPELPPEADQTLLKALSKDAAERFESSASFAASLMGSEAKEAPTAALTDITGIPQAQEPTPTRVIYDPATGAEAAAIPPVREKPAEQSAFRRILSKPWAVFVLGLGLCLCSVCGLAQIWGGGSTRAPAAVQIQPTATATIRRGSTIAPPPPRATPHPRPDWSLILFDTFDGNTHDWPTGITNDDYLRGFSRITGGRYRWQATGKQNFVWWGYPGGTVAEDFHVAVEVEQISGPPGGEAGVVFRLNDNDFYLFEIDDRQRFRIRIQQSGEWNDILGWFRTDAIRVNALNRLALTGTGSHFAFFINDQFVYEMDDDRIEAGKTGLLIGHRRAGVEEIYEFDNFELRAPSD